MRALDGKNLGVLRLEDGGLAGAPRTHAERELELAVRALVYAMEGKGKNLRNVAEGVTFPLRMLCRRFREAKRARRDAVNYRQSKLIVQALDAYVDALYFQRTRDVVEQRLNLEALQQFNPTRTTGDHPRAA